MGDVERVMERVRRLLAIANDPAASDNEQRIALEQAQRLMDRHAIEEWQPDKPKLSKATRPSQAAYRHGRRDGARQAIGLKETGQAGNWTLEK